MTPSTPSTPHRRGVLGLGAGLALGSGLACRTNPARPGTPPPSDPDAMDDLLSDLEDESGSHEPIRPDERRPRRKRLAELLAREGFDALLVEPGPTMSYLTGLEWGHSERLFALVLFADGSLLWVAPSFEVPRALQRVAAALDEEPAAETVLGWDEHEYGYDALAAALTERRVERIGVDPEVRYFVAERLAQAFVRSRVVSGADVVRTLRGRKEPRELALLRAANELTQRAIATVAERLRPGVEDRTIGALIRGAQERLGLTNTWILPLIGPDAAFPHGSPTGRELAPGDAILVDTGGALHGYQSDNTRTWVFDGRPSDELARGWDTVRAAQVAGFEALRPGVPCAAADRAARAVIEAAGYGAGYAAFAHRLGHGIGLRGHEEPYLDGGNELLLEPGMTFSDEPGIYLPGRFGIRIEDIVVITDDGADHFGEWQRSPLSPA